MKILIIGSGGREDALAWKLNNEKGIERVYICPGNPGMLRHEKVSCISQKDHAQLIQFCQEEKIDLTIVGPEAPLTHGICDEFEKANLKIFGPKQQAAKLEGSKIYSKKFMEEFDIPTASFEVYDNFESALEGLNSWGVEERGIVIKADGLAGGKGVVVTRNYNEALTTLQDFMVNPEISVKTDRILFEEVLPGEEVSAFALCHGDEFFFLGCACDHKRVNDNDEGPNTGGMGCYHDPQWPDVDLISKIKERVLLPTLEGCKRRGESFSGFLFMGLMIDERNDPYVVEYNVRLGDPEAQTLLPLIQGNLGEFLLGTINKKKDSVGLSLRKSASVHVVATSGGYPSVDKTPLSLNHDISFGFQDSNTNLFLAGVGRNENGFVNTGGRVLGVTCLGENVAEARELAYKGMEEIHFQDMHYRLDIAKKIRGKRR